MSGEEEAIEKQGGGYRTGDSRLSRRFPGIKGSPAHGPEDPPPRHLPVHRHGGGGRDPPDRGLESASDRPGGDHDKAVRAHVARRVGAYASPATLTWVDSLPRVATGKVDRRALAPEPPAA